MSIVLAGNVQDKGVPMSIHGKKIMKAVTNFRNAKHAATVWKILLRAKYRQLCCLTVMAEIASSKGRVLTTKTKTHIRFRKHFSANHSQLQRNLSQKRQTSFHGIILSTPHWLIQITKNSFQSQFIHFQPTVKQPDFLNFQRRYWMVSRLRTRFSYSDCRRSRPRKDNKFPRKSCGILELVFVSKTRLFEQRSSASSGYPQPARDYGDDGRSVFKFRCKRYGHKRVSGVGSGGYRVSLGGS